MALTPEDDKLLDLALNKKRDQDKPGPEKATAVAPVLNNNTNSLVLAATEAGVSIPSEKMDIIHKFMDSAKFGHQATIVMKCQGVACPFLNMCPLHEAELDLPIGKRCPVEKAVMEQWVSRSIAALDIDPLDPEYSIDMEMVYEIAGMELIRMRAAYELSESPKLVEEKIVGYSPQGDPIYDEKPAASLFIIERNSKAINKIREQLLATRKAQASVGHLQGDPSIRAAKLKEKAKTIALKRQQMGTITDAEYEIKDEDT